MNAANELLRRDIGDQTKNYLAANRKGCVVFGPPGVSASTARGIGAVSLYNRGTSYVVWSSRSISRGFG